MIPFALGSAMSTEAIPKAPPVWRAIGTRGNPAGREDDASPPRRDGRCYRLAPSPAESVRDRAIGAAWTPRPAPR